MVILFRFGNAAKVCEEERESYLYVVLLLHCCPIPFIYYPLPHPAAVDVNASMQSLKWYVFFPFYFYLITTLLITQNVWIECSLQIGWEHNGFDDISLSLWAIKKCIKVDNELFIPFTPWMNETETLKSMPAFFLISETIKKKHLKPINRIR